MPVTPENSVSKNENYVFSKKTRPTSTRPRQSCPPRYAKLGRCLLTPARQKPEQHHDGNWAFRAPLPQNTATRPIVCVSVAAPIRPSSEVTGWSWRKGNHASLAPQRGQEVKAGQSHQSQTRVTQSTLKYTGIGRKSKSK